VTRMLHGLDNPVMFWDDIIKGVGQEFDNVKDFRAQFIHVEEEMEKDLVKEIYEQYGVWRGKEVAQKELVQPREYCFLGLGPWSQQIREGMIEDFTRAAQACSIEDFNTYHMTYSGTIFPIPDMDTVPFYSNITSNMGINDFLGHLKRNFLYKLSMKPLAVYSHSKVQIFKEATIRKILWILDLCMHSYLTFSFILQKEHMNDFFLVNPHVIKIL
ncbi:hypothetical protein ACJX0J_007457, partial [Zea mays]